MQKTTWSGFKCSACGHELRITSSFLYEAERVTCEGCGAVLKDRKNEPTATMVTCGADKLEACPNCKGQRWLTPLSWDEPGIPCPKCNPDGEDGK